MNVCGKCGCDIWPDTGCSCPGGSPSGRWVESPPANNRECDPRMCTPEQEAVIKAAVEMERAAHSKGYSWRHISDVVVAVDALLKAEPGWKP